MPIIISQNGRDAVKVDRTSIDKEGYLQEYIYTNPDSIPLYEIKEDIQLLVLAREFSTNSGPKDAIGIDQYGELYIIETKLYKNPDKRTVIGQALDYGAALWKHANDFNEFVSQFDRHAQKIFDIGIRDKIAEFFALSPDEVEAVLETMRRNLDDGVFHFVVLMDQLTDRLKDLVLYVNQNSQFDIYAVEFEYYKHDEYEIIIPKLFGAEVKKDIGVKTKNSPRESWNEEKLLNQARELLSDKEFNGFKEFYEFSKQSADQINFGSGQTSSFNPVWLKYSDRSLFSVYSDGTLKVNFHWLLKEDGSNKELIDKLRNNLSDAGLDIPEGHTDERLIYKNKKLPQELFLVFL